MHIYTNSPPVGNKPASQRHASFARQAALDAFGPRAIHVLDDTDFQGREPLDELHDPDEAVAFAELIRG